MKIVFDISTPKQVRFFRGWAEEIVANRHTMTATVARWRAQRIFSGMRFPLERIVNLIRTTAEGA